LSWVFVTQDRKKARKKERKKERKKARKKERQKERKKARKKERVDTTHGCNMPQHTTTKLQRLQRTATYHNTL